jgi:hypothetical protein
MKLQRQLDRRAKQEEKLAKRREAREEPKPEPGETLAGEEPRKTGQGGKGDRGVPLKLLMQAGRRKEPTVRFVISGDGRRGQGRIDARQSRCVPRGRPD